MKLIIQIPCKNEEQHLPLVLNELPKHIDGIDTIEVLVIDDGSSDRTSEVAKAHGVQHILKFPANRGLGTAFRL
jgi:glycosyltransferase involved in cell wall biosynthesis